MNKSPNAIYVGDDVSFAPDSGIVIPAQIVEVPVGDSDTFRIRFVDTQSERCVARSEFRIRFVDTQSERCVARSEFTWPIPE